MAEQRNRLFRPGTARTGGLKPSPPADAYTLVRRVSLDLTGLPPTIEEAQEFVADQREGAYERLVDRLLASDAYGEHWARMWLDVVGRWRGKGRLHVW